MSLRIQKFIALGIHASISLLVVTIAGSLIWWLWYPSVLFTLDGGIQGLKILALVEVVLGPILTFIVYRPNKPKLFLDLSVIGAIQVFCLSAGLYVIYGERPLSVTQINDTLFTANAVSYDFYGINPKFLSKYSGSYPKFLYTTPSHHKNSNPLAIVKRKPDRLSEKNLSPITENIEQSINHGMELDEIPKEKKELKTHAQTIWNLYKEAYPNARFYKIIAKHSSTYVFFDPESNTLIDSIPEEHAK